MRLYLVNRNPYTRNGRWTSKTEEKLQLLSVARNPFARNGRWTSKTEEKLRLYLVNRNPDTRNGRWTSKTEQKSTASWYRAYLVCQTQESCFQFRNERADASHWIVRCTFLGSDVNEWTRCVSPQEM